MNSRSQPSSIGSIDTSIIRIAVMALVMALDAASYGQAGWLTNYTYRRVLTIDSAKVDGILTNAPVLVALSASNFDFAKANTNGYDIRFTAADGVTLLAYERERHDAALGRGEFWVNLPSVNTGMVNQFYMYYRKADASDGSEAARVWDTNTFQGVWHLGEDIASTNTQYAYKDATSLCSDGGDFVNSTGKLGKIGYGQQFNGTQDVIQLPANMYYNGPATYETWVNLGANVGGGGAGAWFLGKGNRDGYVRLGTGIGVQGTNLFGAASSSGTTEWYDNLRKGVLLNTWYHVVFTMTGYGAGQTGTLYLNGVQVATYTGTAADAGYAAAIGGGNGNPTKALNGWMDEPRWMRGVCSQAWIKFDYHSGNDSLLTYGSEETSPYAAGGPAPWLKGYLYRRKFEVDYGKCDELMTNFPVLMALTSNKFDFARSTTNGADVRFTDADGGTLLAFERERHDAALQRAEYWVKIPVVYSNRPVFFYMYYSPNSMPDVSNRTNVWANRYQGVWHLAETLAGTNNVDLYRDSTSFTNHGDDFISGTDKLGKIGLGQEFAASTYDHIRLPTRMYFNGPATYSIWLLRKTTDSKDVVIFGRGDSRGFDSCMGIQRRGTTFNILAGSYYGTGSSDWRNNNCTKTVYTNGDWYNIVFTMSGTGSSQTGMLYRNGCVVAQYVGTTATNFSSYRPAMGLGLSYVTTNNCLDGYLDEVSLSDAARSPAWIRAAYHAQNDSLLGYGEEEQARISGTLILVR